MRHTARHARLAAAVVLTLVPLVAATAAGSAATAAGSAATGSVQAAVPTVYQTTRTKVMIPVRDGITLSALVTRPTAPGRFPLLVMPGTFAGDSLNIDLVAGKFAERGYVTVTYLERGFGASGGEIDAGGPKDVADVSDVLTWTLATVPEADGSRVGFASISYGAGFGPMVAARDPRFTAVAMLSGWGDMWRSRYPGDTPAFASNLALYWLAATKGRLSAEVKALFEGALRGEDTPALRAIARERSPMTYLAEINRAGTPLYMTTSMNEMIWPADQTIDFFTAYTGPKYLDIMPGDHAATEWGTPFGLVGDAWETAITFADAYVAGTDGSFLARSAVRVAPRGPDGTNALERRAYEFYPRVADGPRSRRLWLASSNGVLSTGTALRTTPGTGTKRLREGTNLLLQSGLPMFQGVFEVLTGTPTTVVPDLMDQGVTGLWYSAPLESSLSLRGSTRVHLDLTPSAERGSAFVYLLARAPGLGSTFVVGHKPISWKGATPGRATGLDLAIPYQGFEVPKGYRLIVAVSTGDVLYTDANQAGSSIRIGPGSYVDLPLK